MSIRGWVYVLSNKAMPDLVKIGFSTKDPALRASELEGTGIPHPFCVEYDVLVINPRDVEQSVHRRLMDCREGKEFFRLTTYEAIQAIQSELISRGESALLESGQYGTSDLKKNINGISPLTYSGVFKCSKCFEDCEFSWKEQLPPILVCSKCGNNQLSNKHFEILAEKSSVTVTNSEFPLITSKQENWDLIECQPVDFQLKVAKDSRTPSYALERLYYLSSDNDVIWAVLNNPNCPEKFLSSLFHDSPVGIYHFEYAIYSGLAKNDRIVKKYGSRLIKALLSFEGNCNKDELNEIIKQIQKSINFGDDKSLKILAEDAVSLLSNSPEMSSGALTELWDSTTDMKVCELILEHPNCPISLLSSIFEYSDGIYYDSGWELKHYIAVAKNTACPKDLLVPLVHALVCFNEDDQIKERNQYLRDVCNKCGYPITSALELADEIKHSDADTIRHKRTLSWP